MATTVFWYVTQLAFVPRDEPIDGDDEATIDCELCDLLFATPTALDAVLKGKVWAAEHATRGYLDFAGFIRMRSADRERPGDGTDLGGAIFEATRAEFDSWLARSPASAVDRRAASDAPSILDDGLQWYVADLVFALPPDDDDDANRWCETCEALVAAPCDADAFTKAAAWASAYAVDGELELILIDGMRLLGANQPDDGTVLDRQRRKLRRGELRSRVTDPTELTAVSFEGIDSRRPLGEIFARSQRKREEDD